MPFDRLKVEAILVLGDLTVLMNILDSAESESSWDLKGRGAKQTLL